MALTWRAQQQPPWPAFARYSVDIVSPELPCGASWIGNVLLELGVPIWDPWGADTRGEWQHDGARRFRYQRADEGWRRLLPALQHGREFAFRDHPVPRLGHHWPGQYAALPALLVVRDPRDALYSAWRRERALGALPADMPFAQFVDAPFRTWPVSWAAYLSLHTARWQTQLTRSGGLILRFEAFKRDPLTQARRVLAMLKLDVDDSELARALRASDHANVRQAEADLLAQGRVRSALLAGGQPEEWRTHFDCTMHAALPAWLWQVFAPLGYLPEHPGSRTPAPSAAQLHALHDFIPVTAAAPTANEPGIRSDTR